MPDFKLYGGEVTLSYSPTKHEYFCDGVRVPSVTQITDCANKPWLKPWLIKRASEIVQEIVRPEEEYDEIDIIGLGNELKSRLWVGREADIGTLVHGWIDSWLNTEAIGKLPSLPTNIEAKQCCSNFLDWYDETEPEVHAIEAKTYSRKYGYAGTLDLDITPTKGEFAGARGIVDTKTSKGFYPEMGMQLSAYRESREEEGYGPYDFVGILLLPKYGDRYQFKTYKNDWEGFEGLLKFKRWRDGN